LAQRSKRRESQDSRVLAWIERARPSTIGSLGKGFRVEKDEGNFQAHLCVFHLRQETVRNQPFFNLSMVAIRSCVSQLLTSRRNVIESELEMLYDAYYEELENFAKSGSSDTGIPFPLADNRHRHDAYDDYSSDESDEDDDDYSYDDDDSSRHTHHFDHGRGAFAPHANGVLTVADDFLKNDGRKFLELMDQVAERKIQAEDRKHDRVRISDDEDDYEYGEGISVSTLYLESCV